MNKFYLIVWLRWMWRLTLTSLLNAIIITLLIVLVLYIKEGMPPLSSDLNKALLDIATFWFAIVWNATLLLALFRGMKYIFNKPANGYELQLLICPKDGKSDVIEVVGYGDLVKVWRKWFMLLIWLVCVAMIFATVFSYFLLDTNTMFGWFNIYILFAFVLFAGYFSFMILSSRCKKVRIHKC